MTQTLYLLFYGWLTTYLLQFVGYLSISRLPLKHLKDNGWGYGRLIGWLLISLVIWFGAHLKLPINTTPAVFIITAILGISLVILNYKHLPKITTQLKQSFPIIVISEALFFIGFMFQGLIRAHAPNILDLEKFMDAGFMATYLRATTLPAPDMWLAGETINYYSFGHFMGSIMTRLWSIDLAFSYNLLLALVLGLSLVLSYTVIINFAHLTLPKITTPKLIFAGLIGALLVNLAGNTHAIWYLLDNGSFGGYWYPNATRFIENTIHEFPAYSYIVSDLHGHLWALPLLFIQLTLISAWFIATLKNQSLKLQLLTAATSGGFLGIMLTTNAWDFAIYGLVSTLSGLMLFIQKPQRLLALIASALTMLLSAIAMSSPWWLNFESISEGTAWVTERSPLWQFFVLWAGHLSWALLSIIIFIIFIKKFKKPNQRFIWFIPVLATTSLVLLILPEVVYVKDIYPGHPRANTMFKLTYQAFILMSLLGGWAIAALTQLKIHLPVKLSLGLIMILVFSITIIYPYFGFRDYYGALKTHHGLDGLKWLSDQYPDDYQALQWMNQNISGQPVILEAVGESYTTFNRISAFTGLPTVLGWRVHEWLWRGGFDIPGQRTEEVRTIYELPLSQEAFDYLDLYQVEYIFVGDKEREGYPNISEDELKLHGQIVFESGNTYILHRQQ